MDIPYKGPRFTWCNKREDHSIVLERLDKGYGSWDWNDIFTNSGSVTVIMIRKLSRARNCMRIWSISKRKEWNKKWSDFDDTLVKGLHEIETKGVTQTFTDAYSSQVEYAKVSAKYWKQRAKIKWNIEGDTCSNVNKGFLSPDGRDALGIRFTPKEVYTAVFQLGPLKSPGPDGMPAFFFHKCWHFIKHDVIGTVLAMLNGNSSPEFLNKTLLVLIPKSSAPETVDNFRPISLCNVIMKIIRRCITNRLKKFMGKLVGDFQNAFVPGRNTGNSKRCESLDKVIKDYYHASGHVINDNKSSMTLSSCYTLSFARKCLKTFNIPCGANMGTYLGIPTDVGLSGGNKSKREIFEFIIDKFSFYRWCSRLFLSQPKGNGGLGIRRMKKFNQARLSKIGWRMIIHPDSILSKFIGAKYGLKWRDGDLLFNDGKSNSSWGWKVSVGTIESCLCLLMKLLRIKFLLFRFDVLKAATPSTGWLRRPGITQLRLAITLHYKIHGILQLLRRTVQEFLLRVWEFFRKSYGTYLDRKVGSFLFGNFSLNRCPLGK
ncbi:uncharacterized protein LOC141607854 [Silene latifolia]|uniref:uncharacterized protein LOC141607854 n=1 Tax=Silene latifolia TaxID=37657 RepID=UPI003D775871